LTIIKKSGVDRSTSCHSFEKCFIYQWATSL